MSVFAITIEQDQYGKVELTSSNQGLSPEIIAMQLRAFIDTFDKDYFSNAANNRTVLGPHL